MAPALPDYYPITAPLEGVHPRSPILAQSECRAWLAGFRKLLADNPPWVQLRVKSLPREQLETLARHCLDIASARGVGLVLNGPPDVVRDLGFAGIHLTSHALTTLIRRPLPGDFLVGASCHSAGELAQAVAIGADFACLSPVRRSKGGSGESTLGITGFTGLVADCPMPVYALGGMRREDLGEVRRAGGQGVAGISAFWR